MEWWAAILIYLWLKGCKNTTQSAQSLENMVLTDTWTLRTFSINLITIYGLLWISCFVAKGPAYDTGNQTFQVFSDWREEGKELENICFKFPDQYLLELGQHPEENPKGRIHWPRWWQAKMWAHSRICDTLLQHSKTVFCAAAIADCSSLTVLSRYA